MKSSTSKPTTIYLNLFIFLAALLIPFLIQTHNRSILSKDIPSAVRMEKTIITADDLSYLVPPRNYINSGEWRANQLTEVSYFLRNLPDRIIPPD